MANNSFTAIGISEQYAGDRYTDSQPAATRR